MASLPQSSAHSYGSELLELYLSLPVQSRGKYFLNTSRAARLTGLSRRTIQWWAESGTVNAILIGRRYQIENRSLLRHLRKQLGD